MSLTSEDFPDPYTPVTAMNKPSGSSTVRSRRLCSRAPTMRNTRSPSGTRRRGGTGMRSSPRSERARGDDLAAVAAGARAQVQHMVGGADRLFVVLDDEHGVAEVAQLAQCVEQPGVVALMQADGGLVEDVEHADQAAADLGREPDALRLAARQGLCGAAERQIVKSHLVGEGKPVFPSLGNGPPDPGVEPPPRPLPRRG